MSELTKMQFPEGYQCQYKEKVMKLANMIGRKKADAVPGGEGSYQWDDPEYVCLEAGISDEMAEVALCLGSFEKKTVPQVAEMMGKSAEYCREVLMDLAVYGACKVGTLNGEDVFWTETWIPGHMEMIVNNAENIKKYPVVAYAMEAYGRVRGGGSVGSFPVGVGLMRVIPIQSAIDGSSRKADYEEISKYVEENTIFCVSDCSCRTDREVMGEGCGHLKEDMCIQMGTAAEYYIRTGRARQITKDEVYEILQRAEENGLMHEIPNADGPGKTHAICNCCGCGCLSIRTATMFKNVDMIRSNYVAKIDPEKCTACGQCVENCPVNALKLGQKLCSSTPIVEDITSTSTPRDEEWPEEKWNVEYRVNRENVVDSGTSPCKTKCPAHIGVQGYVKLASQGKYQEALELIKKENPFPAVCGRICNRRCEDACTRGEIDDPVAIDDIKDFIAQQELNAENRYVPQMLNQLNKPFAEKIAVIGAGPAGMSCAFYLAQKGYPVTVFEKADRPGGMLMHGIPSFRLEKDVIEAEIDVLRQMGVEFKCGVEVGKDLTIAGLREEGYKAFYIAIGCQGGRKIGVAGEDAEGVDTGVEFLYKVNSGADASLTGRTVVVGGGNVAIDVARAAARSGASEVSMYCLESRDIMPAADDEVEEAEEEDIKINNSWGPAEILTENGKVKAVVFKKCVSVFDDNGRFAPVYDEKDTITVECENVLLSVGQSIQWGGLLEGSKVALGRGNGAEADPVTYQTAEPDIFVGGDVYTGPKFAIDAIAAGKEASVSIHRFVHEGQSLTIGRNLRQYIELDKKNLDIAEDSYDNSSRQVPGRSDEDAKTTFRDLRKPLTEEQIAVETARCLGCGASVVDYNQCIGCGVCTTKCEFDAIHLNRELEASKMMRSEDKMKGILPYAAKRQIKIMRNKKANKRR